MSTKTLIYIGIAIFGALGGWLGSMLDGGDMFGLWGILGSTIGGLFGIWIGFKIGNS